MDPKELEIVLKKHKKWLLSEPGGERADLRRANLTGDEIDYSAWPLWCHSLDVHVDERQVAQLLYHVLCLVKYSKHISEETKQLLMTENNLAVALKFHRADECERLSMEDAENDKQK